MSNFILVAYTVCATVTSAMEGSDKQNTEDHREDSPDRTPTTSREDLYGLYCAFAEQSRVAMLRVILCAESRRTLVSEEPVLAESDFFERLQAMPNEVRRDFLTRIRSGYELARETMREELLKKYRPAA